jgi:hypothetical protein
MNATVIIVLNKIVSRVNLSNKIRSIKDGQFRLFSVNFRSLIEPRRAVEQVAIGEIRMIFRDLTLVVIWK